MILPLKYLKFTLTLFFLIGVLFRGNSKNLTISFKPLFSNQPFLLKQPYITTKGDTIEVDLCKVYLTNFQLKYKNGTIYKEPNSFHLINLSYDSTLILELKDIPSGNIERIHFNIGIDSATSCSGAMPGALDPMYGMYWAWNSGYVNAKLEGKSPTCESRNNEFQFHIGGYKSKEATIQKVSFDIKRKNQNTINFTMDLSAWFNNLNLSTENSILIPGKEAIKMAKRYSNMFFIN